MCTNKLLHTILSVAALKIQGSFRKFFPLTGIFKIHLFTKIQKNICKNRKAVLFLSHVFVTLQKLHFQK